MDYNSIYVPVVRGLSFSQIEKEASAFLNLVSPESLKSPQPTPVLSIFENKMDLFCFSIVVGKNIKGLGGITNISDRFVELSLSTYKRLEKNDPQAKFTVAHEFGHVMLHSKNQSFGYFPSRAEVSFSRRSQIRAFEDPEWQANTFAANVLMPLQTMHSLYLRQEMTPEKVMDIYQVSWSAATRRVLRLNIYFSERSRRGL